MTERLRLGISECLLGRKVRWDGGHKHDRYLTDTLGEWVEWVPTCPEVEIGLGTPRPPIRIVATGKGDRLVVRKTGEDITGRMTAWAEQALEGFAGVDGFVLKKDSPSCGMERVRRHHGDQQVTRDGRGVFAAALLERYPLLPVEEEGRLNDPGLREHFVARVFAYRRWKDFLATGPSAGALVAFHAANKMALHSHHPGEYRALGRLVAGAGTTGLGALLDEYGTAMMHLLRHRATRKRHTDVLQHLAGHLKKEIDAEDRAELAELIESYRQGVVPLVVPLTMLRHHARRHGSEWLRSQTYLQPYPDELMLRNHV
ncbi:MAG: DUF523 and DUF1722 domain-containing protein [Actinobacteria bacterium]|nr:DUF523 and DUF1722 domain-containing protein [Actinomycetota bacterium]